MPKHTKPILNQKFTPTANQNDSGERRLYSPPLQKDPKIKVCWSYPADYVIAMSSLGYLNLFKQLDMDPEIEVRRTYTDQLLPNQLESNHSSQPDDWVGFSFSFELDIFNILKTLKALGIQTKAADRTEEDPLVFAGGPVVMTNPEPYADFFDFFLIGEGEGLMEDLKAAYLKLKDACGSRLELLAELAKQVQGLYVPSLYEVTYKSSQGPIASIQPKLEGIPFPVQKRFLSLKEMETTLATSPILTANSIFSDIFLVEVVRGCAHRCRFCLASYSMLPARGAGLEAIQAAIEEGLKHTPKIGLVGALIADHPEFEALCEKLLERMKQGEAIRLSSASLRADTLSPVIAQTFKQGGQNQLTIAVESGSEWLRRRINKNLKETEIFKAAETVYQAGLRGLKIYGMVGLPDETDEDIDAMADLMRRLKKAFPKLEFHLGCSSFVPKAATPFQWMPRLENSTIDKRFERLRKGTLKTCDFRPSSTKWDFVQAVFSRGDRRLAPVIERYGEIGASYGSLNRAVKALRAEGRIDFPNLEWYALRERPETEILPWDVLHLGVDKAILYKEGLLPPGLENRINHSLQSVPVSV